MRERVAPFLILFCITLSGCNQPAVSLKPFAVQRSENTVRDWDDLAHTISKRIALAGLLAPPTETSAAAPPSRPIFIRVQAPDSPFVRAVADELESDILEQGGQLVRSPFNATVVNLDVEFVSWGRRDKLPGLTSLAGFEVVPLLGDLIYAMTPTTTAEAIWKATVISGDRVVMRMQNPVYIRNSDLSLYARATSLPELTSCSTSAPLETRVVRYQP